MATLAGLREAYQSEASDLNRQNLARFLIRNDEVAEGRMLAMAPLNGVDLGRENISALEAADVELVERRQVLGGERRNINTGLLQDPQNPGRQVVMAPVMLDYALGGISHGGAQLGTPAPRRARCPMACR